MTDSTYSRLAYNFFFKLEYVHWMHSFMYTDYETLGLDLSLSIQIGVNTAATCMVQTHNLSVFVTNIVHLQFYRNKKLLSLTRNQSSRYSCIFTIDLCL